MHVSKWAENRSEKIVLRQSLKLESSSSYGITLTRTLI